MKYHIPSNAKIQNVGRLHMKSSHHPPISLPFIENFENQSKKSKIGVAILSTDRSNCLLRLLQSIKEHPPKRTIDIFIVDDSSSPNLTESVSRSVGIGKFIHTGHRIGIAKNTNAAIDILLPYDFKIILNNDVSILSNDSFLLYPAATLSTDYHLWSFRQLGLWGACREGESDKRPDVRTNVNGIGIATVQEFPQGAILAFDRLVFETIGYFDESFTGYGYSHHLWVNAFGYSKLQPRGFHDLSLSNNYFKVYNEECCTPHKKRIEDYQRNAELYKQHLQDIISGNRSIFTTKGD
jgi:hypothetical protein